MNIYLYIKTHKITGMRYLGKTTQNPFDYPGSGVDWIEHIKIYGSDHSTEILRECFSKEELNHWGKYYSRLFNVVNAMDDFGNKIWANRIPETGGGWGKRGLRGPTGKQKNPSGPRGKQKNPSGPRRKRGAMPEETKQKLRVPKGKQKNPHGPRGPYGKQKNPSQKHTCKCGVTMNPGRFKQLGHGDNCKNLINTVL